MIGLQKSKITWHDACNGRDNNESSLMNTTLKFLLLLLGAAYPCIAFAGLIGIHAPAARPKSIR